QRLLLTLLNHVGTVSNTDFQKLLFLYVQECEERPTYEFVPYKFGAFSFTSYADKRRLIQAGLLAPADDKWQLTKAGMQSAEDGALMPLVVSSFCQRYSRLRGKALIAEQYRKYPYYATRSEIVRNILSDSSSHGAIRKAQPKKRGMGLVTIGYQG